MQRILSVALFFVTLMFPNFGSASDSTRMQLAVLKQHMQCTLTGLEHSPYIEINSKDEISVNDPFALITFLATPLEGTKVNASIDLIHDSNLKTNDIKYVREILIEDSKLQKPLSAIIQVKDCVNPNDENHITALTIKVLSHENREYCCYIK